MRKLQDWLKAYTSYASFSEAPEKFHYWTGISTIAGALRRKVWIDQKYFQWTPNFYIIFVAPPGIVSKSTTASIGMDLLREIPEVKFGPNAVTWQALVQSLSAAQDSFNIPIDGEDQFHTMSALTISSSEIGSFLDPKDRHMVDVLVDLWDGQLGVFEKDTKTQGSDKIINPWINIIACTTPAWIADNFPEYMIGGGFTARTIFVYAEDKKHLVAYPALEVPDNFEERKLVLIHDLEIIASQLQGEYKLTNEAIVWGKAWYEKLYHEIPLHLNNKRFKTYIARKQTHLHKTAIVIAASRSNELFIDVEHLKEADLALQSIELDMPKVFANIGMNDITMMCSELREYVKIEKRVELNRAYKRFMDRATAQDFELMLASIFRTGEFKLLSNGNEGFIVYKGELK